MPPRDSERKGLPRALAFVALLAVAALLVSIASTGLRTLSSIRHTSDDDTDVYAACVERWLDAFPDGTNIYAAPEAPAGLDLFWVATIGEQAFPRLRVTDVAAEADFLTQVVPEDTPVTGRQTCAGFKMVVTSPNQFEDATDANGPRCNPGATDPPTEVDATSNSSIDQLIDHLIENGDEPLPRGSRVGTSSIVCDRLKAIGLAVPDTWSDVGSDPGTLRASTNLSGRVEAEPVITLSVTRYLTEQPRAEQILDGNAGGSLESGTRSPRQGRSIADGCAAQPPEAYDDGTLSGQAQLYLNCDGDRRGWLLVTAFPKNGEMYRVDVIAQAVTESDAIAIGQALSSIEVAPDRLPLL